MMEVTTSGGVSVEFQNDKAVDPEDPTTSSYELLSEHDAEKVQKSCGENFPLFGPEVFEAFYNRVERKGTDSRTEIVKIGNIELRPEPGQPLAKPSRPDDYIYPQKGKAGRAVERVARAIKYGRSVYLYSHAGTGKSDLFRCLAHDLNMEFSLYPMREDLDTATYIGHMAVVIDEDTGQNKTEFVPGRLLKDIQGRVGKDGVRRPVMIQMDDLDRAPAQYTEILRHILDGAQELFVPELGRSLPVYPGTLVVATANSRGRGDEFGRYSSVQQMDDSILDRFHRFIEHDFLEPEEERKIVEKKFPYVAFKAPQAIDDMMKCVGTLRHMVRQGEVFFSFSTRRVEDWMCSIEELIQENDGAYAEWMLGRGALDWLDRYDTDTRKAVVERALKAYIPSDYLDEHRW